MSGLLISILKALALYGDPRFSSKTIEDARFELREFFNLRKHANHTFEIDLKNSRIREKDEDLEGGGCIRVYEFDPYAKVLKVRLLEESFLDYGKQNFSLKEGLIIEEYFKDAMMKNFTEERRKELLIYSEWHRPWMFFRLEFLVHSTNNYTEIINAIEGELELAMQIQRLVWSVLESKIDKKSLLIGDVDSVLSRIERYENGRYANELRSILSQFEDLEHTLEKDKFLVRQAEFAVNTLKKLKDVIARCFPESSVNR